MENRRHSRVGCGCPPFPGGPAVVPGEPHLKIEFILHRISKVCTLSSKNKSLYSHTHLFCKNFLYTSIVSARRRKRIYIEQKAKVVALYQGAELLQFLATLATLFQDDLNNRRIRTMTSRRIGCKSAYSSTRPS